MRAGLKAFIAETGVDELMIVSDLYDHPARLRSIERIAEAMTPQAAGSSAAWPRRGRQQKMIVGDPHV